MEVTQEQLIQIVTSSINPMFEQLSAQQRITQEQQRITQEQQRIAQEKTEQTLVLVCQKLAIIERNTLIILGQPVSETSNMSDQTKLSIQESVEEILTTPEQRELVEQFVADYRNPLFKKDRKGAVKTAPILRSYNPVATAGEARAAGNWTGNILSKVFGIKFDGKYHPVLKTPIELLVGHYAVERDAARLY